MRFAVDYDGTLVDRNTPRTGAFEALRRLSAAGHTIILHSSRCVTLDEVDPQDAKRDIAEFFATGRVADVVSDQWDRFDEMRDFLKAQGVWPLVTVWQAPGKPEADVYIDDLAEQPNWQSIIREFAA